MWIYNCMPKGWQFFWKLFRFNAKSSVPASRLWLVKKSYWLRNHFVWTRKPEYAQNHAIAQNLKYWTHASAYLYWIQRWALAVPCVCSRVRTVSGNLEPHVKWTANSWPARSASKVFKYLFCTREVQVKIWRTARNFWTLAQLWPVFEPTHRTKDVHVKTFPILVLFFGATYRRHVTLISFSLPEPKAVIPNGSISACLNGLALVGLAAALLMSLGGMAGGGRTPACKRRASVKDDERLWAGHLRFFSFKT